MDAETEKDLGMMTSNDLKVSHQCLSAYNKANKILGIINRTIVYKTIDVMLRQTTSRILYCTAACPFYIKDKELVERIQDKFTSLPCTMNLAPFRFIFL